MSPRQASCAGLSTRCSTRSRSASTPCPSSNTPQ
ncbi:hypothetical protein VHUM_02659 [Vanrija humicola]|uniref:Uncharacterized protein n=1 Tax=Vanrija humicola TaxID=5417 RepID=A0A7D8Z940_VANHU|nr:hypothetical protein VHUM_02659 [Vanrija humicola]